MEPKNRSPQGTHNTAPTTYRPNINGNYHCCGKKGHKEQEIRSKKRDKATKQPQDNQKGQLRQERPKETQNWCETHFDTRVTQHETEDTERKVHLPSETSHMTSRILTQTGGLASISSHRTKEPR